tara:strand:- start:9239 stop:9613 length:375 start_codon:yes stop_codon:yes gene_type:complete
MNRRYSRRIFRVLAVLLAGATLSCQKEDASEDASAKAEPVIEVNSLAAVSDPPPEVANSKNTTVPVINVNEATATELEGLPKIGGVLATRIIEGRPYGAVEDLLEVQGLGAGTLEEIRELISVE